MHNNLSIDWEDSEQEQGLRVMENGLRVIVSKHKEAECVLKNGKTAKGISGLRRLTLNIYSPTGVKETTARGQPLWGQESKKPEWWQKRCHLKIRSKTSDRDEKYHGWKYSDR